MAHTTQHHPAMMFDEVKELIDTSSRAVARRFYLRQARMFHDRYSLTLSPYMDWVWTLSAARNGNRTCRFAVTYLSARDWIDTPEQAAEAFFTRFSNYRRRAWRIP